jgi:hypothetical protein
MTSTSRFEIDLNKQKPQGFLKLSALGSKWRLASCSIPEISHKATMENQIVRQPSRNKYSHQTWRMCLDRPTVLSYTRAHRPKDRIPNQTTVHHHHRVR